MHKQPHTAVATRRRLPLWLKVLYTLFVAILVPVYWHHYGFGDRLFIYWSTHWVLRRVMPKP